MTSTARRLATAALLVACVAGAARAESTPPALELGPVYWVPIDDGPEVARGMIDPWMSFFVRRYVENAKEANASAIVFAIKTYGGSVDSAIEISNTIRSASPMPTIAYVDDRAISAGALVALACDWIYMEEGSTMGAAQGILMGPEGGREYAGERSDKEASFLRAGFRAQAERRGRKAPYPESTIALAEAMTDPDIAVIRVRVDDEEVYVREKELSEFTRKREDEGKQVTVLETVLEKGKLLTMTAREAYDEYRFVDGVVADRAALLSVLGKTEADVVSAEVSWPQEIARFVGGPMISGLLISIAVIALFIEIYTPGSGIGGFVFLFAISLFFWSHFLAGQAGPVEVVLFLVGVGLLAVEVFLIPGFGVAGIAGIVLILGSLIFAFLPGDFLPEGNEGGFPWEGLGDALSVVLVAFVASAFAIFALARYLPRAPLFGELMTRPPKAGTAAEGVAVGGKPLDAYTGKRAVAVTDLRPSGKVEVDSDVIDAVAEAEFISEGENVRVTEVSGNRVVVARGGSDPGATETGDGEKA